MNKKQKIIKYPRLVKGEAFVRDRGNTFGQTYRKSVYCPECLTKLSDNIIRLRDGLFECRKCGAIWTK